MSAWETVILGLVAIVFVVFLALVHRAEATTRCPLPALDRTARTATVVAVAPSPGTGTTSMIEVEYLDAAGLLRREYLADLFEGDGHTAVDFPVGTQCEVYGFATPQGRCLLTETHAAAPRRGYNLDHLRTRTERQGFPARPGSSILGVMRFAGEGVRGTTPVTGPRTSWPGDPTSAWAQAQTSARPIVRPGPAPQLDTVKGLSRELRTGVLCEVYASPLTISGGDSDTTTTIAIDVAVDNVRAARLVAAFTIWGERAEARDAWGQEPGWIVYQTLTSTELFGADAVGGYMVRDCPAQPGEWVVLAETDDGEYPDAPMRNSRPTRVVHPKKKPRRG